jgi:hypothetical protein
MHTYNQNWALPIQVSIFRYSILIGYKKVSKYRTKKVSEYRYCITNFQLRYADTLLIKGTRIGSKVAITKEIVDLLTIE